MSTKTTFKRIALVAVAALGLGVLSVAPSSATVSALTVTGANGTSTLSTTGYVSDSTTAATVTVSGLLDTLADTVTVTFIQKSVPSTATAVPFAYFMETTTALASSTQVDSFTGTTVWAAGKLANVTGAGADTITAAVALGQAFRISHTSTGYVGAKFAVQLDSASARIAGTYTYTAIVKAYNTGVLSTTTLTQDVSIVVSASAATTALTGATAIDSGLTRAWFNAGATYTTANDSAVSVVSTAASTDHATLRVTTFTAAGNPAPESITVTVTGAGVICNAGACGKSIKVIGTAGSTDFTLRADGTAGTSTIVVATTSKTFPAKTANFYAKAASTFATPSVARPVIGTGSVDDVVRVTATDASGNSWTGTAYIYATSAASALIAGSATPVACIYDAGDGRHECPVSGTSTGTASFKIIDASTVALATATSAEVSVRVSTASAATVSLSFDKASYLPGEKAIIKATVLDAAGLALPEGAITNLFATGGITNNSTLTRIGSASNDLTGVTQTVKGANSSSNPDNLQYAGSVAYMYTMPQSTGTVTLTAKGGAGLPLAGQVTVTTSAEVTNPSADAATDAANEATDAANAATDAALAAADAADAATAAAQDASDAVAALSATVAKLVASLKAQITSLTNLVIKIQKKVKA
jgi:hypothetical protein